MVRRLLGWTDNESFNAILHLLATIEVAEHEAVRRKQIVQLSRYAHAGRADECLGWGDVDLRRFNEIYEELAEVLSSEGAGAGTEQ